MSLSRKDVEKMAHLARLQITEQEIEYYREGLSRILGVIDRMNEVDTRTTAPLFHPNEEALRLREDRPDGAIDRDRMQQIAPQAQDGLYLVPKVIE
ncbi:MAG: Asp-tRNA(Asn)/Glu-tRNA(Gln) amidotransferase subunit GatC [Acidiferrobacteraceae bacterium]